MRAGSLGGGDLGLGLHSAEEEQRKETNFAETGRKAFIAIKELFFSLY